MTDKGRFAAIGAFVVVVHGILLVLATPARLPAPQAAPAVTRIGISTVSRPVPAPSAALDRPPRPSPVPPLSSPPTPAAGPPPTEEADLPPAVLPPDPVSPLVPDPLTEPPRQTAPAVSAQVVLSRLVYPPQALRRRLEAIVVVELVIDADGRVLQAQAAEDPGHGFADAAVRALEGLEVIPATQGGRPVASRLRYPVRFVLP